MNVVRSSLAVFVARSASVAVGFVALAYYARAVGATGLGVYFLFQALTFALSLLADLGLRTAIEKRISERADAATVLGTGVLVKLPLLALVVVAVLVAREPIAGYVGADVAPLLAGAVVLRELARTTRHVVSGELAVEWTAVMELARKAVQVTIGVGLVATGAGARGLIYAFCCGFAAMFLTGVVRQSTVPGRPSVETARSLVAYARHDGITQVGSVASEYVDLLVVGAVMSQSHVGAYEVAWRIASVVLAFSESLGLAVFPQVSDWSGRDATDRVEAMLPGVLTLSAVVVVPAVVGGAVIARDLLAVAFGPGYELAWVALVVLLAHDLSTSVSRVTLRTLRGLDRPDLAARSVTANVVCNVALNLLLVPPFGLAGAAVATTAAALVRDGLALRYLSALVAVRVQRSVLGWAVVAAGVMGGCVAAFGAVIGVSGPLELAAAVGLGVAVYVSVVLTNRSLRTLVGAVWRALVHGRPLQVPAPDAR